VRVRGVRRGHQVDVHGRDRALGAEPLPERAAGPDLVGPGAGDLPDDPLARGTGRAIQDAPSRLSDTCVSLSAHGAQPLMAPEVMPATIWRLKKTYMTSGGIVMSRMFVNSRFQDV
jgi:hypothetical protein